MLELLHRSINIGSNGTLAVVTALRLYKLTNNAHRHLVPWFRQTIEIHGVSYSIMHQQFPIQFACGIDFKLGMSIGRFDPVGLMSLSCKPP